MFIFDFRARFSTGFFVLKYLTYPKFSEILITEIILKKYLLIFLTSSFLFSQSFVNNSEEHYSEIADQLIKSSLSEMRGYDWLRDLCENIGPRLSGSEESMRAIYWAKEKFEAMGVDSVWLQPVMVPKWERGDFEEAEIMNSKKYTGRKLNVAALGGSISTSKDGLSANIVEVFSLDELKDRADEINGNFVFFNRPYNQSNVSTFRGYGEMGDQRTRGPAEAAKYGAVGAIVRSITTKYDNTPHVGTMFFPDSIDKIPAVAIGLVDADFLSSALKEEPELKVNLRLDAKNNEEVLSYNVIAQINGTLYPDELIVVGGHWDSWDKGCGAHDDGGPCIQTMEVLDIFKRFNIQPKRTIRCVLFINEENGIKGALAYADSSSNAGEKHLSAIESDRGVFTPRGFTTDADSVTLAKLQNWLPILNKATIDWIRPGGTGVDISRIKNAKAMFGYYPDPQRYFDVHHSDNDTFDQVNPREMQLGTAAIAILTYLLSEEGL